MSDPGPTRLPHWWFVLHLLTFSGVPFVLAAWLLLVAPQPMAVKVFAASAVALAGIWNLVRAWRRFTR